MERLTPIAEDRGRGKQAFCEPECKQDCEECYIYDMFQRLATYEDTDLSPKKVNELIAENQSLDASLVDVHEHEEELWIDCNKAETKLKIYEDAEKSGDIYKGEVIHDAICETAACHPYKVDGDYDSINPYNEGWSDACDAIASELGIDY